MSFDTIDYEGSTEKAYKCILNKKVQWIPKSVSSPVQGFKNKLNIAPFLFQNLTGRVPQTLDTFEIEEVEDNRQYHTLEDYPLVNPYGVLLKPLQWERVQKIWRLNVFSINAEMRTGKTFMASVVINSRYHAGMINRLLVVAPLRVKNVWQSMFERLDLAECQFVPIEHFSNIHKRDNLELNIDEKTFVVIDESHTIKNKDSFRTQHFIKLCRKAKHKCTITGTPIGLHAGDLFFQFHFLDPFILGYESFDKMAQSHLLYGGNEGKKVIGYTNIETISQRISPYVLQLTRKELGEERPVTYSKIHYSLKNREAYNNLAAKYFAVIDTFSKFEIMRLNTRLQQSACGFILDDKEQVAGFEDNGRITKLQELIKRRKGIGVVYFKYTQEAEAIKKKLQCPVIWGANSQKEFERITKDFNEGKIPILLVQQRLSQGFSLRRADYIVYFSTIYDYIIRSQSMDRAKEGNAPLEIIDLIADGTIDERIQEVIDFKSDVFSAINKEVKLRQYVQ